MESLEEREGRGPNAPAETLASAIQLLQLVRDRLGFSSASRESVAEALGYRTLNGTSRRKIAALSHFDLLTRTGAAYRISELGKQILIPRDDAEYRHALSIAARKPAFYQRLFAKYEGQALPGMLPNVLVREFGILPQSSEEVARTFRESQEYAGLLRNGILHPEPEIPGGRGTDVLEVTSSAATPASQGSSTPDGAATTPTQLETSTGDGRSRQRYTIPLDKRGTLAAVELPVPVRDRDLRKLSAWISYMRSVIEDEEETSVEQEVSTAG